MNLLTEENSPQTCSALGLDCRSCVQKSAASVAKICHGLDARALEQVFVQLYSSAGCRPMMSAFGSAYLDVSAPRPVRMMTAVASAAVVAA